MVENQGAAATISGGRDGQGCQRPRIGYERSGRICYGDRRGDALPLRLPLTPVPPPPAGSASWPGRPRPECPHASVDETLR